MNDELPSFKELLAREYIKKAIGPNQSLLPQNGEEWDPNKVEYGVRQGNKTKSGINRGGYTNHGKYRLDNLIVNTNGVAPALKIGGEPIAMFVDEPPVDDDSNKYMFPMDYYDKGLRGKYVRRMTPFEQVLAQGFSPEDAQKFVDNHSGDAIKEYMGDTIPLPVLQAIFSNIFSNKFDYGNDSDEGKKEALFDISKEDPLKLTELFAGIGAQARALKNLNIPFRSTISEYSNKKHKGYVTLNGDVKNIGDVTQMLSLPDTDILTYSTPCQDISRSGKGMGFAEDSGTRSSLLWQVKRLLNETPIKRRPKVLVMENVKDILSPKFRPYLNKWINDLKKLGYTSEFTVMNAKDYGVPQNRERFFMVSHLGNGRFIFPEPSKEKKVLRDILQRDVPASRYIPLEKLSNFDSKFWGNPQKKQKRNEKENNYGNRWF